MAEADIRSGLVHLLGKSERLVAGLMSGTSGDGVDCAVIHARGSGSLLGVEVLSFVSLPYPAPVRKAVLENSERDTSSVEAISQLNFRLAYEFEKCVRAACEAAGIAQRALELVGSHGQTIHHLPDAVEFAGAATRSTLQVGDPSVLANLLGVPVVGDFRVADMALGGQGAPLVPYGDYVLFRHNEEDRILLNVGGIANITILEAGTSPEAVIAFDTGPGNMLIDGVVQKRFGRPFDEGGALGAKGRVHTELLDLMLEDEYYKRRPPKSTGRERFGSAYLDALLLRADSLDCSDADTVATATELTARTIVDAIRKFTSFAGSGFQLVVGGGGSHNSLLMSRLASHLPQATVMKTDELGIMADAREAVCFAVIAHETLNQHPASIAAVTGARHSAILGKICLPSR